MKTLNSLHNRPFERSLRQTGVSLIELMIALAISMVLTAVIGYAYLGSSQVFRTIDASARLQEGARFAFEEIGRSIRMAGFDGCGAQYTSNTLKNSSSWSYNLFGQPVMGYEDSATSFPNPITYPAAITTAVPTPANRVLRGDAITILQSNPSGLAIDDHNANAATFHVSDTHCIKEGTILVACGQATCNSISPTIPISLSVVFQMSGPTNNNCSIQNINHDKGNNASPGNFTKDIGPEIAPGPTPTNDSCQFSSAQIMELSGVIYFIRTNPHGEPALYRQFLTPETDSDGNSTGNATTKPEELVEGVENMQITYGVDTVFTDADGDLMDDKKEPTQYVTADQVTTAVPIDGTNIVTAEDQWKQVRTVRISLLMVSRQDESVTSAEQTYTFGGNPPPTPQPTVVPTDRRLRKAFTTVIAVRNRL